MRKGTLLLFTFLLNFSLFASYPITIDGDPSDWENNDDGYDGSQLAIHGTGVFGAQWIYKGESGDQRTDISNHEDNDILEARFGTDGVYFYFLITMQDIEDGGDYVYLSMGLDSDNNSSDVGLNWNGDDSQLSYGNAVQYAERNITIHDITSGFGTNIDIELFADDGSNWYNPSSFLINVSTTNEVIEGRIALTDLNIPATATINISLASFVNSNSGNNSSVDATQDIGGSNDAIDAMTPGGASGTNAWNRDLSDGDVDNYGTIDLNMANLPIELVRFDARLLNDGIGLFWETSSEIENAYFEILKSQDKESWKKIGQISGQGNSTKTINYESFDENPFNGMNYYRLKQVDFDGNFEYSNVVSINFGDSHSFNIYPNPVSNEIKLDFDKEIDSEIKFEIFASNGQLVKTSPLDRTNKNLTIDVSDLNNGIYYLKIWDGKNSLVGQQKFVK